MKKKKIYNVSMVRIISKKKKNKIFKKCKMNLRTILYPKEKIKLKIKIKSLLLDLNYLMKTQMIM